MNVAGPSSSHKAEMNLNDLAMFGNLHAILALKGNFRCDERPECVACVALLSGKSTIGLLINGLWLSKGAFIAT